ncbi:MAG: hypothetical protein SFV17_07305 [Candidatus Obscuribacter sp.]|nr:hypothetical protein [Candidatus Melainabacteria bacterium]MDX1986477.1 hypothetical protein [Candidatus Obscuribacter sp.]
METRQETLAQINAALSAAGLKTISKLGDYTKGEFEITGIKEIFAHSARFFTDVKFAAKLPPSGNAGEFTVRFNANGAVSDGAVIVAIVNYKFAIVKQWRLPLQRWTYEIARGFGDRADKARINGALGTLKLGDLPLGTLTREFGEEVMADAEITSVTHLGNIAENSGTHAVTPSCYLVQIEAPNLPDKLSGSEELKVELWTMEKVKSEIGKKLCDAHSLAAILLYMRHTGALPRFS